MFLQIMMWTRQLHPAVNGLLIAVVAISFFVAKGELIIRECTNSTRHIAKSEPEKEKITFTCDGIPPMEEGQWILKLKYEIRSLTCDTQMKCTSGAEASRPDPGTIQLVLEPNNKTWDNVTCSYGNNNFTVCKIIVNTISPTQGPRTTGAQAPPVTSTPSQQSPGTQVPPSFTPSTTKRTQEDNDDLPVAAIAGGVAAAVAVIIIVIIIVVVVVLKRRKKQKTASKGHANNNDREEHVNPLYGSEDAPAYASPPNNKPSGVALMLPAQNNYGNTAPSQANGPANIEQPDDGIDVGYASVEFGDKQQAASPSAGQKFEGPSPQTAATSLDTATTFVTDADMYVAVDGPGQSTEVRAAAEEADMGYSTVGSSSVMPSATAPSGDVYAVVQKPGTRAKSTASGSTAGGPADTSAEGAGNTYAVVNKSRSSDPAASSTGTTSPHDQSSDNADSTYAAVDKSRPSAPATSSAGNASSRGPTSNNAYAFVSKSSPGEHGGASFTTADTTAQTSSGDVYAQVDKSAKQKRQASYGDDQMQSPESAPVYAQVNKQPRGDNTTAAHSQEKPKPATKPKLAVKPKVTGFE